MDQLPIIETLNATATIRIPDNDNDFGFLDEFLKSCIPAPAKDPTSDEQLIDFGSQAINPLLLQQSFCINPKLGVCVGLNLNHNFVGTVQFQSTSSNRTSTILELLWDEWGELKHHNRSTQLFFERKSSYSTHHLQTPICETCGAATKASFPSVINVTDHVSIEFTKKSKLKVVNYRKNNSCIQLFKNDCKKLMEIQELISLRLKRLQHIQFAMFYNTIITTMLDRPILNISTGEYVNKILDEYAKSNTNIVYEHLAAMYEILTSYVYKLDSDLIDMKQKTQLKHVNSGVCVGGKRIKMY